MTGHIKENTMDAVLRLRVPPELKRRLMKVAMKRRKADMSELVRELLWTVVEAEDPQVPGGEQLELSATAAKR